MANKNPFEIRSDMLQLAKDYMDQQYYMNKEKKKKMFEAGKKSVEELQEANKMYSMEELMEKAREMYTFVSEKGDK